MSGTYTHEEAFLQSLPLVRTTGTSSRFTVRGVEIGGPAPVVIAGPFTSEGNNPDWPEQLKERLGEETTIHFVWCPPALRRERIIARGETRDLPKLAAWEAYVATCRDERPVFPHVFVEST